MVQAQKAPEQTPSGGDLLKVLADFWEPFSRAIIDSLKVKPSDRVLDAGCGRGGHLLIFAEKLRGKGTATGLDINPAALAAARVAVEASGLESRTLLKEGNLFSPPCEPASFDLIWSSHVFHALGDVDTAMKALKRLVRPGGRIVIRENRVNTSVLPYDVGFGRSGAEFRSDGLFLDWLIEDREKRGRIPHGWLQVLHSAGLDQVQTKSFLHEVQPPFTEMQKRYILYHLRRKLEWKSLSNDDRITLGELIDAQSPRFALHRRDLHFLSVSTIYSGVVPARRIGN